MTINEYQEGALETAIYPNSIIYPTIGLTGEAGEVADKVKKVLRDKNGEFFKDPSTREEIMKEIGDVLWYCATLANDLGYSLEEVAEANIKKLSSRKERGMLGGNGDNR